jgi:hypothetical protein
MATPQQQMIVDAFNSEIYVANRMDVQHTPIYDTITLNAGSAVSNLTTAFFTNVGAQSNKTLAATNMTQSQRLPAPEAFSIFGFRLRWSENIYSVDLLNILNGFALEFYLGQKVYQRAPLWYFGAGGGIAGFNYAAYTATTVGSNILTNGVPVRESMHKLAIPIVIENQMTFYAQLVGTSQNLATSTAGSTGLTLQLLLDGFYARGVQ